MSKYYEIKGLKVRVSDHEPNYSMDRFRGRNDIELYTISLENKKLNLKAQIEKIIESEVGEKHGLQMSDFNEVLGKKERSSALSQAYRMIDHWFENQEGNSEFFADLKKNPSRFAPWRLNAAQKQKWVNYLISKF